MARLAAGVEYEPETAIGHAVLDIASSSSIELLGAACHREVLRVVGSPAVGLYLLDDETPSLSYSGDAPEGFIRDYKEEFNRFDPLLAYVREKRSP